MNREKRKVGIIKGAGQPFIARAQSRNVKCRCGSGKKAKRCCGSETKYYTKNQNHEQ